MILVATNFGLKCTKKISIIGWFDRFWKKRSDPYNGLGSDTKKWRGEGYKATEKNQEFFFF